MDEVAHALGRDPLEFRLSMLNGKGGNRGIPNTGHPAGTRSDYYMDQLWISLPWPKEATWPPYESATVGGALRLANCLRVAAGKAGYGIEETAAEHRHGHRGVVGGRAPEPDLGGGSGGSDGRSARPATIKINRLTIAMDMGIAINPSNIKAQIQGSALWGAEPDLVGAADLQGRRDRADQLPRLQADPAGRCAADRRGDHPVRAIIRAAWASRLPRWSRRPWPTRCSTQSARGCGTCRSRPKRCWKAMGRRHER